MKLTRFDGKLIVFTAPSGSGKTTVVRHLLEQFDELAFSVSATTRKRREHEMHGKDYYYLSADTFQLWVEESAFIEWEEVYTDQMYGTLRSEVERLWSIGKHIIFDIDVRGATNIKKDYPDATTVVFIKVPTLEMLIERLKARGTDTEAGLKKRIARIKRELTYEENFDRVLINDKLDDTLRNARAIIREIIGSGEEE